MLCWYCNICLTEYTAGVPPQSLSQAAQAWEQSMVPPEGTQASHQAIPYEAWWWFTPPPQPPPVVQGPQDQPQHLVRPAGPAPRSSVAPGAVGPSGWTPPLSQAPGSSLAPSGKNKGIEGELKKTFVLPNICVITVSQLCRILCGWWQYIQSVVSGIVFLCAQCLIVELPV